MPIRTLLAAAALFAAVAVGCGETANPLGGSDETARRDAGEALDAVTELRTDLEGQIGRLSDELEASEGVESELARKVERLSRRLDRALDRMSRRLGGLDGAADSAESALAEARAVARELAVLDERLDYHLKSHRGG